MRLSRYTVDFLSVQDLVSFCLVFYTRETVVCEIPTVSEILEPFGYMENAKTIKGLNDRVYGPLKKSTSQRADRTSSSLIDVSSRAGRSSMNAGAVDRLTPAIACLTAGSLPTRRTLQNGS